MAGLLNVTMVMAALRTAETNITNNDAELVLGLYYLTKFGYIQPSNVSAFSTAEATASLVESAVLDFQAFAGLPMTGKLTAETVELMQTPRCGVHDTENHVGYQTRRRKRYALQGSRWQKRTITWRVDRYPQRAKLTQQQVEDTFTEAFRLWAEVTSLVFLRAGSEEPDISIRFYSYQHGDGDAFDGPGGTLAHAYFPQFGGDVHIDDSENWTVQSYKGTNLLQTATHEIGHSLGLSHSNSRTAIMAPFYTGYEPKLALKQDDIQGIRALYGERIEKGRPATPPNTPTTVIYNNNNNNKGRICSPGFKVDTIFRTDDGDTYVFSGSEYWELTKESVAEGYPRPISADWAGLPSNLDTAFTLPESKETYFFKGEKYWKFYNMRPLPGYPKAIKEGFPGIPSNLDAAFVWSGNGKIYFFKGDKFWKFDQDGRPFVRSDKYPASVSVWGLPGPIDVAFQWENGHTYFFRDDKYWRLDDASYQIAAANPPYPRSTATWWFGC